MTDAATAPEAALDDATLTGRARDGDVRAYEQLVLRYQGSMFRLTWRMLADRAAAEAVTQEIFLTAWRRIAQLPDDSAFAVWLYRIAIDRCRIALRPAAGQTAAAPESPGTTALVSALHNLSPEYRACWLLREVHGRSDAEIAQIVGVDLGAVPGRIAAARRQLAEVMTPWP